MSRELVNREARWGGSLGAGRTGADDDSGEGDGAETGVEFCGAHDEQGVRRGDTEGVVG